MEEKDKKKGLLQNWLSVIGGIGSITIFSAILFFILLDLFGRTTNPYNQILTYCFLPVGLVVCLLMIPIGALWERRRRVKHGHAPRFPRVDFNDPRHQRIALVTIGILTIFALFSVFGIYQAYEFTESTTFCGRTCHTVMSPEYTTYQDSPHARVACAECHVGSGVDWFVKAKINGTHQLYSVITQSYPKPIHSPVRNLRPAEQTCEKCHWPEKFFGAVQKENEYFLPDETNTPWKTRMLLFVGGGKPPLGERQGIHWHMNINNKVAYVATDHERQVIPWVKVTRSDGSEEVFVVKSGKFSAGQPPAGEMRSMDCIDCHNRPTHIFHAPSKSLNEAFSAGAINRTLPYIKRESLKVLVADYQTKAEALEKIAEHIKDFYKRKYPEISDARSDDIDQAIQSVQRIYSANFFPEMKTSWKAHPDNLGHLNSPGCFRCHDGEHRSAEGKVIPNDCNLCHSIIAQGWGETIEQSINGLEFKHPDTSVEDWKEMKCYDCHTGGLD